jgi:hypothetical protein
LERHFSVGASNITSVPYDIDTISLPVILNGQGAWSVYNGSKAGEVGPLIRNYLALDAVPFTEDQRIAGRDMLVHQVENTLGYRLRTGIRNFVLMGQAAGPKGPFRPEEWIKNVTSSYTAVIQALEDASRGFPLISGLLIVDPDDLDHSTALSSTRYEQAWKDIKKLADSFLPILITSTQCTDREQRGGPQSPNGPERTMCNV